MDKITAPFSDDQVNALNAFQAAGFVHPFTCCSHEGCDRQKQENEGTLIATTNGWVCPCGKYTQDWAHSSMADTNLLIKMQERLTRLGNPDEN